MRNSLHIVAVYSREGEKVFCFQSDFLLSLWYHCITWSIVLHAFQMGLYSWRETHNFNLSLLLSPHPPPPPLRLISQLLPNAYHLNPGLPGFPAFLFGLKRVSVLSLFNTFDLFSLLEEFNRLCPGGIGFVPDPYTLVIKGMSVLFSLVSSPIKHLEKSWTSFWILCTYSI